MQNVSESFLDALNYLSQVTINLKHSIPVIFISPSKWPSSSGERDMEHNNSANVRTSCFASAEFGMQV